MRRRDFLASGAGAAAWGSDLAPVIRRNGRSLALLNSARREVAALAARAAEVVIPEAEAHLLEDPGAFWKKFAEARYHDYAMLNPKVVTRPVPVSRKVKDGDRFDFEGQEFTVIATPGITPGAVSYLTMKGGRLTAYTGDLIYPGGKLLDIYSLQDAVPEAKLRGYHGYAARAGLLVASLRRLAEEKPKALIPSRGPAIEDPLPAIGTLISRLKRALDEHFRTDALRWYFGDDNLKLRAAKVLEGQAPEWMPMGETRPLPEWIRAIGNSRLIVSRSRAAFLCDCGYDRVIDEIRNLQRQGVVDRLEGIFVTHYHDDHTDRVQKCADAFGCPVYFHERLIPVLESPSSFYMPCLSKDPILEGKAQPHGAGFKWHEFQFTVFDFPGQTFYHDALLAHRDSGENILFVGDSFTPSGLDDYCLRNRNLLADERGYFNCLRQIRSLPRETFLINQHVAPMFRFAADQLDFMEQSLARRRQTLAELFPWPHPDFGLDDQWVRISPYESRARAGETIELQAVVLNHATEALPFELRPVPPTGWRSARESYKVTLPPGRETTVPFRLTPTVTAPGLAVVTADVRLGSTKLMQWTEALVTVI